MALAKRQIDQATGPASAADATHHTLVLGDARSLDWLDVGSIQLAVTSPPYWTLKK